MNSRIARVTQRNLNKREIEALAGEWILKCCSRHFVIEIEKEVITVVETKAGEQ